MFFQINLIIEYVLGLILLICLSLNCEAIKCGEPGQSRRSEVKKGNEEYKVYEEDSVVEYSCDYNDAQFLIGFGKRKCENGVWTHNVPKCASLYTYGFNFSYTPNGNGVNVSLTIPSKIVGLTVKISSQDPIQIVNIKNVPTPECVTHNLTSNEKITTHIRKRFSTQFTCPTKEVDNTKHPVVSWILVTFNEKFRNCELTSCPAILEFIELYELTQDACEIPDLPAFGEAELIPSDTSLLHFRYKCEDNFYLAKEFNYNRKSLDVKCIANGDWSMSSGVSTSSGKTLPQCLPNMTCKLMETKHYLNIEYTRLWNTESAVVGSMAIYECSYNNSRINGSKTRVCMSNGEWSGEEPECVDKPTTTTEMTTTKLTSTSERTTPHASRQTPIQQTYPPITYPPNSQSNLQPNLQPNINPYYTTQLTFVVPPTQPAPPPSNENANSTLALSIGLSIFGALMSAMIAIGIIYFLVKSKQNGSNGNSSDQNKMQNQRNVAPLPRYNSHPRNKFLRQQVSQRTAAPDSFYDDNNMHICPTPEYDSAGYIQIEAVDTIRMDNMNNPNSNPSSHNYEYGRSFKSVQPSREK